MQKYNIDSYGKVVLLISLHDDNTFMVIRFEGLQNTHQVNESQNRMLLLRRGCLLMGV
ncbi:hypothetical protein Lalb_Chr07g0193401 [Lupinus albus]|uniref:Uncharacterized protein n=1 Tax=Lupinus albus TaxID=3870 RepID=A0A6A4QB77_LUPAL|nr:hypothetical protein Lalb_Chr07g0193401 [Lupinus albus]